MTLYMFLALMVLWSGAGCASLKYHGYEEKFTMKPVESSWRVVDPPVLTQQRAWRTVEFNGTWYEVYQNMDLPHCGLDGYFVCFDGEKYFIFVTDSGPACQKGFAVEKETGRLYSVFRRGLPRWPKP